MLEVGLVCFKTRGRTQGDKVVIVEMSKDGNAVVEGIKTKRKSCNPRHLFPTAQKIEVKKDAKRAEIVKLLEEA